MPAHRHSGVSLFFRLPGLMRQFRRENPGVSLRVTTGSPEELIEKWSEGMWT